MSNTFGEIFKITTFGESHGPALGVVIDGVPPNISICESDIQFDLDRRRPGQSNITTQRKEKDKAEILSGVLSGKTTGTPLTILIRNEDHKSKDYDNIKDILRPGHADYTFLKKYGIRDHKGGGRASGRETICRVAAGAIAKKILRDLNINIVTYTLAINGIYAKTFDYSVIEKNLVRSPDLTASNEMIDAIEHAKNNGDSVGGIVEAIVKGCPVGLGDPVFNKLDALLSHAIMSIGSIKAIEFGSGFKCAQMLGSDHNDKLYTDADKIRTITNHAGGILGGISNGETIVIRAAIKPTSSIAQSQQTITTDNQTTQINIEGRHDPCLTPRIIPVVEAMIAITILDRFLFQKTIS